MIDTLHPQYPTSVGTTALRRSQKDPASVVYRIGDGREHSVPRLFADPYAVKVGASSGPLLARQGPLLSA